MKSNNIQIKKQKSKINNCLILVIVFILPLFSCDDFLDVSSESKLSEEVVYGNIDEANRVLTSVYTALLANGIYGRNYLSDLALNSDVEFATYSSPYTGAEGRDFRCFDGRSNGSTAASTWADSYRGIERANVFIKGVYGGAIFIDTDPAIEPDKYAQVMQMLGEAKVLRAMLYHDLVVYFGDVPFTTEPTCVACDVIDLVTPIADRNEILTYLINDLRGIEPYMKWARELDHGVERVSREFCLAMIARMALTRGGYALYPDLNNAAAVGTMQRPSDYMDYYKIAMNYAQAVINSGTHALNKPFRQVFLDQCNHIVDNYDDPIFEISFLRNSSGDVGFVHGPQVQTRSGETVHEWGECNGGARLNAFYRFSFDKKDLRRDYTIGMTYYDAGGQVQVRTGHNTHCNKWSKLWSPPMGSGSRGGTGINFPYMRYADVLLMYAEAVNEVEYGVWGPNGENAKNALKQVRSRAFAAEDHPEKVEQYVEAASNSKEDFFEAIFHERKWEFGGENMRWKDLVRWNLYSRVVLESFKEFYYAALWSEGDGQYSYPEYYQDPYTADYMKVDNLPWTIYWRRHGYLSNGTSISGESSNPNNVNIFPNLSLPYLEFYKHPTDGRESLYDHFQSNPGSSQWSSSNFFRWITSEGFINANCLYSFRGYVSARGGASDPPAGVPLFEDNVFADRNNLPPVRYILPIPMTAINLSMGTYTNYYGY